MRAVVFDTFGGPEVMYVADRPVPEPAPGEVLVRVAAAGVNPIDWIAREGVLGTYFGTPPYVLGWDVSGVVHALGDGVTEFRVGDEVFGMPRFPVAGGGYAEFAAIPAAELAIKPVSIDHAHAAGVPLVGLTVLQSFDIADLRPGQRVLIHAAAGGVGSTAVQIAKARGAYVVGTASEANHAYLRELGADEVIDYTAVAFEDAIGGMDLVLDVRGADYAMRSLRTLKPGGLLFSLVSGVTPDVAAAASAAGVRTGGTAVRPDGAGMRALALRIDGGDLRTHLDHLLPLEQVVEAHTIGKSGHVRGKIVLAVSL
jgi:NADPH:quinone reductase-like Zn-dependent oxidoreductase